MLHSWISQDLYDLANLFLEDPAPAAGVFQPHEHLAAIHTSVTKVVHIFFRQHHHLLGDKGVCSKC